MDSKLPVFENIWLADDDRDDCEMFTDVISQILPFANVTIVSNGEMLMQKLEDTNKPPDCLFLDINMPLMDGLECLLQIRAKRNFSSLPVIIFSSTTQQAHLNSSYQYGANLFFTKPSSFAELIAGLSTIFKMNWKSRDKNAFQPFLLTDSEDETH